MLGNRITGKAFRHSKDLEGVSGRTGRFNVTSWGAGGDSEVGMKSEVLQNLLKGAAARGQEEEEERKISKTGRNYLKKKIVPGFQEIFSLLFF